MSNYDTFRLTFILLDRKIQQSIFKLAIKVLLSYEKSRST